MPTHRHALVLGGARSGKSLYAEGLVSGMEPPVVYVATARPIDDEMAERIAHHRARRPAAWRTLELPTRLPAALANVPGVRTVLVEDLTLLLSNHFLEDTSRAEQRTVQEVEDLFAVSVNLVLVSNEVGMGLVPETPLGRQFRDALGRVNQRAAALCDQVYFVVAGLPLQIK